MLTLAKIFNTIGKGAASMIMVAREQIDGAREVVRSVFNVLPIDLIYMLGVWVIGITTVIAHISDTTKPHRFLRIFYLCVSGFAALSMLSLTGIIKALLVVAYGIAGYLVEGIIMKNKAELEELSHEEGYPEFSDNFDQTHTIKNTTLKYLDYINLVESHREKNAKDGERMKKAIEEGDVEPEPFIPGEMAELVPPVVNGDYDREKRDVHGEDDDVFRLCE
jgi:hypothetical protein